jgi:hypothetical protein
MDKSGGLRQRLERLGWWFVLVAVGLRLLVVAVAAGFWAGTGKSGVLSSTCYR